MKDVKEIVNGLVQEWQFDNRYNDISLHLAELKQAIAAALQVERDHLQKQRALLVEACKLVEGAKESLHHMEACRWCAEDWNDCDGGIKAFGRVADMAALLSRPEVVELLKEQQKGVTS